MPKARSIEDAFLAYIDKTSSPHGCWLWRGGVVNTYGQCRYKNKRMYAHRLSWEYHIEPIPEGLCVLHDCPGGDNPLCVNPKHLWLGTTQDNTKDRDLKGHTAKGKRNGG